MTQDERNIRAAEQQCLDGMKSWEAASHPLPPSHDVAFLAILGLVFAGALALLAVVGAG